MRYIFIDENTIEPAPKGLMVEDGKKFLPNPSDADYQRAGIWEVETDERPDDGYSYSQYYEEGDGVILAHWRRGEPIEAPPEDATTKFMKTLSSAETNSIAKIRAAAKDFLADTEGES